MGLQTIVVASSGVANMVISGFLALFFFMVFLLFFKSRMFGGSSVEVFDPLVCFAALWAASDSWAEGLERLVSVGALQGLASLWLWLASAALPE